MLSGKVALGKKRKCQLLAWFLNHLSRSLSRATFEHSGASAASSDQPHALALSVQCSLNSFSFCCMPMAYFAFRAFYLERSSKCPGLGHVSPKDGNLAVAGHAHCKVSDDFPFWEVRSLVLF